MSPTQPSGAVLFPLASNAHALISGSSIDSVRVRLKVASLLYDQVLVETGQRLIMAGPEGSITLPRPTSPDRPPAWQTPRERHEGQTSPFSLDMSPEHEPGVPSTEPFQRVVHSMASISWSPTLEPFARELPSGCDWILFGALGSIGAAGKELAERWKRHDDGSAALKRLVPEHFVRSTLIDHVSKDLAAGAIGGWDISTDRFHGNVLAARFAGDGSIRGGGFALPILVPRVSRLSWEDVAALRRLRAIRRLREELRAVEAEVLDLGDQTGDVEGAVRRAYETRLRAAVGDVGGIRSIAGHALVNLLVGTAVGYATLGLTVTGPAVGGAAGAAISTALEVRKTVRQRGERAWVGVLGRISDTTAS